MAKTFQFTTTFDSTVVVSQETVDSLVAARAAIKAIVGTKSFAATRARSDGHDRFMQDLFLSEKSDDEVIAQIIRIGMRDSIRANVAEKNSDQTIKVGDVVVTQK